MHCGINFPKDEVEMSIFTVKNLITSDCEKPNMITRTEIGSGATGKSALDVTNKISFNDMSSGAWAALDVVSASLYTTGFQFGELFEITGVPTSGLIVGCELQSDHVTLLPDLNLFLFGSEPTITSSDRTALNIAEASMDLCVGRLRIRLGHYDGESTGSHKTARVNLPESDNGGAQVYELDASETSMWGIFQVAADITPNASGDYRFRVKLAGG